MSFLILPVFQDMNDAYSTKSDWLLKGQIPEYYDMILSCYLMISCLLFDNAVYNDQDVNIPPWENMWYLHEKICDPSLICSINLQYLL